MDMLFDCAIIGGGPAGLNAPLSLDEQDEMPYCLIIIILGMPLHRNLMDLLPVMG